MFILGDRRIALLSGNVDSDELVVEEPARARRRIALLRSKRECILVGTCDAVIVRDVLAVSGIESIPYCAFICELTKRQPSVVSNTELLRENAESAFGITNGARDIPSTPPAIISSASPARIARAQMPTASMLDPHKRLIVAAGTSVGRPASNTAIRATLRLSSPA